MLNYFVSAVFTMMIVTFSPFTHLTKIWGGDTVMNWYGTMLLFAKVTTSGQPTTNNIILGVTDSDDFCLWLQKVI